MILLDTQVFVWWTTNGPRLAQRHRDAIQIAEPHGVYVSAISVWVETARERGSILLTTDGKILKYVEVETLGPD